MTQGITANSNSRIKNPSDGLIGMSWPLPDGVQKSHSLVYSNRRGLKIEILKVIQGITGG